VTATPANSKSIGRRRLGKYEVTRKEIIEVDRRLDVILLSMDRIAALVEARTGDTVEVEEVKAKVRKQVSAAQKARDAKAEKKLADPLHTLATNIAVANPGLKIAAVVSKFKAAAKGKGIVVPDYDPSTFRRWVTAAWKTIPGRSV
jgi:hypothetical protein